jgi:eukaryotic-like serine/threonine-protein kinase
LPGINIRPAPAKLREDEMKKRVSELFDEVADLTDGARARYLAERHVNEATRGELEELLAFDCHWSTSLQHDLGLVAQAAIAQLEHGDRRCGPYLLGDLLGRGGMGAVYAAERVDGEVARKVAVKLLPLGADTAGRRKRFLAERQMLASLNHPGIAALLDAGHTSQGQPYLVMEHIDGAPIDVYAKGLDVRSTLELFIRVCEAVFYAHQNLIVHRDLKPSNILVDKRGEPKLLDFGIAKLLQNQDDSGEANLLTSESGGALTPAYAAPEQVSGGQVTTATDVYALGVLLYVLLTGQHPAGAGPHSCADLLRAVVETEPQRLSDAMPRHKLPGLFRKDLDTIVAKALKKDPNERYLSVAALAGDVRRYLNHEPIEARADTFAYRTAKLVRRHRTSFGLALVAFFASAAGIVGTLNQARTARAQRDFALRQLSRAEAINDLNSYVLSDAAPSGKQFTVNDLLARAESIIKRQRGAGDSTRVDLLISIGRQYTVQDEYAKARLLLEEAHRLSRGLPDASTRGRASCSLAQALSRAGDLARADALFRDGLKTLPAEPRYALDRMFCLERGSEIASNSGNSREAVARAQAARDMLPQLPVRSELAELNSLITLASAYSGAGRFQQAVAAFEQAAARLTELGRSDTQRSGTVFNNWGAVLIRAGRPLEAERVLRRSIDISMASGTEEAVQAMPLVNYARVLLDLGKSDQAEDYAGRGLAKAREAGDEVPIREGLLLLAAIYRDKGNLDRAAGVLSEAAARFDRSLPPGHAVFAGLARQRALNAQAAGDLPAALAFANEAVAIAEASIKIRGAHRLPPFLICRSEIALQLGRVDDAQTDAARAMTILRDEGQSETPSGNLGRAYLTLGRVLQAQGKHADARAAFRSAADHLRNALGSDHPDTRRAQEQAGGRRL